MRSYNNKSKFLKTVFTNSAVKPQHILFANELSSNIPLYIEKNPVEKLCKVLEMELKTYTPVDPKFVSDKIKFKVFHYIQHDLIRQRPGLSEDQISIDFMLSSRHARVSEWIYAP